VADPQGEQEGAGKMALTRMTLEEVMARAAARTPGEQAEFRRRMDATTEEDIRRHKIEDGEDADAEPGEAEVIVPPQHVRKQLGMTQAEFASLLNIPVATLCNWEQDRFTLEPAVRTLLRLIYREPEAALRALRRPRAAA
jgi:putative transcriptional regulator